MADRNFKLGFVLGMAAGIAGSLAAYTKRDALMRRVGRFRVRTEIYRRLEDLRRITRNTYDEIVDDALARHRAVLDMGADELADFTEELKRGYLRAKRKFERVADTVKEREDESGEDS